MNFSEHISRPRESPAPASHLVPDDALRLLQTQADLQYHAAPVRRIFNSPAATGMGFWSINPYIGCAFGCAYCYARDTHRWTLERAGADGARVAESMPAWLAFERRILVKENADARLRDALRSSREAYNRTDKLSQSMRRLRVCLDPARWQPERRILIL